MKCDKKIMSDNIFLIHVYMEAFLFIQYTIPFYVITKLHYRCRLLCDFTASTAIFNRLCCDSAYTNSSSALAD